MPAFPVREKTISEKLAAIRKASDGNGDEVSGVEVNGDASTATTTDPGPTTAPTDVEAIPPSTEERGGMDEGSAETRERSPEVHTDANTSAEGVPAETAPASDDQSAEQNIRKL